MNESECVCVCARVFKIKLIFKLNKLLNHKKENKNQLFMSSGIIAKKIKNEEGLRMRE